ncbi:MAG: carbohydrate kinase family protein [Rhodospirillaceae bacterium]|nr:carbohydrate kinase family protein [Rhodospirillaceae bacterium]
MSRRGILTGGTWCVDRNKLVDFWPPEDGLAEILAFDLHGGGSGCNLAIDVRKLDPGLPVATIGLVGDDEDGRFLLAQADVHGIDRSRLALTREAPTQYTDAFTSRRSGRRTHIFFRGTASLLTPDHFDFAGRGERIFHLGLPGVHEVMDAPWRGEPNGWVATLKKARAAGLETNLELASVAPERIAALVRPCLPHLDLLVVNDVEIGAIAGLRIVEDGRTDVAGCVAAARAVLAEGAMRLVVAHFPLGAVAVGRDGEPVLMPSVAVPPEAVVGTNGAGDAFAAGLLYALHEGWTLTEALRLAHATAAASLRSVSTTGSVESWQACLALAERWGWRPPL